MFIVLPLSHERMQAQRLPYITIGIVVLNVLLYLITAVIAPKTAEERYEHEYRLVDYYLSHPYLELPDGTFEKLSPGAREQIEFMRELNMEDSFEDAREQTGLTERMMELMSPEQQADWQSRQEELEQLRQQEQEKLDDFVQAFEKSFQNDFYLKYGYIPARRGIFTIFSSMFLHGGLLHLLSNMLFLWLSGCNIEDLWGRGIFPAFYLLGGVIATLAHGMMYPESPIPLVGASGAIAAVMGAFMVRLYDTRIHFVYLIFMFRFLRGRFSAPAYLMLPLWLLQQFWQAASAGSSGVAFWAHIGGFVFGAAVAALFQVTGFEQKFITPALDKKTAVLDEHLAAGMTKLQEGEVDGAITELREAIKEHPDDVIAHGELSRAYFRKGNRRLALREFKRAVYIYMKQGDLTKAVDEYLDLIADMPELMLDPPRQMKIATALEERAFDEREKYRDEEEAIEKERAMFAKAADAYRNLALHYQRTAKTLDTPEAVTALVRYANISLDHLEQAQEAYKAYKIALRSSHLPPEQQEQVKAKAQRAMQMVSRQAKKVKLLKHQIREQTKQFSDAKQREQAKQASQKPAPQPSPPQKAKPQIPMQKRIKFVQETAAPAKYPVRSVAPLEANKVLPGPGGMNLKRPSDPPVRFEDIYVICVAQVTETTQRVKQVVKSKHGKRKKDYVKSDEKHELLMADIFIGGQSRPYRLASDRIAYPQFFEKPLANSIDNFRQFILYMISHIDSVYLDQGTVNFLKTGKARMFSSPDDLQIHEKTFWKQLCGAVRFQCENCWEVYWVDGRKIPEAGVQTKCTRCGHPIRVQPLQWRD